MTTEPATNDEALRYSFSANCSMTFGSYTGGVGDVAHAPSSAEAPSA